MTVSWLIARLESLRAAGYGDAPVLVASTGESIAGSMIVADPGADPVAVLT